MDAVHQTCDQRQENRPGIFTFAGTLFPSPRVRLKTAATLFLSMMSSPSPLAKWCRGTSRSLRPLEFWSSRRRETLSCPACAALRCPPRWLRMLTWTSPCRQHQSLPLQVFTLYSCSVFCCTVWGASQMSIARYSGLAKASIDPS